MGFTFRLQLIGYLTNRSFYNHMLEGNTVGLFLWAHIISILAAVAERKHWSFSGLIFTPTEFIKKIPGILVGPSTTIHLRLIPLTQFFEADLIYTQCALQRNVSPALLHKYYQFLILPCITSYAAADRRAILGYEQAKIGTDENHWVALAEALESTAKRFFMEMGAVVQYDSVNPPVPKPWQQTEVSVDALMPLDTLELFFRYPGETLIAKLLFLNTSNVANKITSALSKYRIPPRASSPFGQLCLDWNVAVIRFGAKTLNKIHEPILTACSPHAVHFADIVNAYMAYLDNLTTLGRVFNLPSFSNIQHLPKSCSLAYVRAADNKLFIADRRNNICERIDITPAVCQQFDDSINFRTIHPGTGIPLTWDILAILDAVIHHLPSSCIEPSSQARSKVDPKVNTTK